MVNDDDGHIDVFAHETPIFDSDDDGEEAAADLFLLHDLAINLVEFPRAIVVDSEVGEIKQESEPEADIPQ